MTTNRRHGLLDYAAIRARISIGDVLALLNYRPHRTQATKCRGRCPLHQNDQPPDSQSTCFSVDLQRNLFQCFGCGAQGNQLDLWRRVHKRPLFPASLHLCQQAGIEPPWLPSPPVTPTHQSCNSTQNPPRTATH